ncbi:uncharacterized protein EDB93DRAFT_1254977 [Suillus bovinus]|uniref:uncharacterized protein n=1 Tax=Suillus bovinus TaxID=48563 RepID=UPI001B87EBCB|nr:uncharacterized protein EDB93DRAFT_1254977 [Suillus bovinus]KAG2133204.1 hypothetical protein EDB93DRAFT_1254977 [Suillus bovinus]
MPFVCYYKNHEATSSSFIEGGWYRTDDLDIIDSNSMHLVSCIKVIDIIHGVTYGIPELETHLQTFEGVTHSFLAAVPYSFLVRKLKGFRPAALALAPATRIPCRLTWLSSSQLSSALICFPSISIPHLFSSFRAPASTMFFSCLHFLSAHHVERPSSMRLSADTPPTIPHAHHQEPPH